MLLISKKKQRKYDIKEDMSFDIPDSTEIIKIREIEQTSDRFRQRMSALLYKGVDRTIVV